MKPKPPSMTFDRTGFILYTLRYSECVDFYGNLVGLPLLFETETLTCFQFGGAYLMVEIDDEHDGITPEPTRLKTCLRINVSDVKALAEELTRKGVSVDYQEHSWGTVAKFFDPDGNLCAFKDSGKFEKQVQEG